MTPKTKLQELFAHAADIARNMFLDSGEILPMWHAVTKDGENMLIATPWNSDEEKHFAERGLRQMFQVHGVQRYVFISEVWMAQARSFEEVNTGPRPSEHPDRREALFLAAEDRAGNAISGHFFILRPEHGKPTLSPLHMDDFDGKVGRFTGMLT